MGEVVEQEAVRAARQRRAGAENSDQSEPAPPRRYAAEPIALFDMGNNESEEDQEEWYDAAEVEENDQSDQAGPHVRYGGVQGVRQVPAGHRLAVAPSQEPADQLQYVGHLQDENLAEAGRMQQDGEVEGELKKLHHPGHPAHPAAPRGYAGQYRGLLQTPRLSEYSHRGAVCPGQRVEQGGEVHPGRPAQRGEGDQPVGLQDELQAEAEWIQQDGEVEGELKKLHHPGHPAHPAAPRGYAGQYRGLLQTPDSGYSTTGSEYSHFGAVCVGQRVEQGGGAHSGRPAQRGGGDQPAGLQDELQAEDEWIRQDGVVEGELRLHLHSLQQEPGQQELQHHKKVQGGGTPGQP